jgi:hypothetical protein
MPIKSRIAAFVPHESSMAIGSGSAWTTSGATWLAWTKRARVLACAGVLLVARRNSSDAGKSMYIEGMPDTGHVGESMDGDARWKPHPVQESYCPWGLGCEPFWSLVIGQLCSVGPRFKWSLHNSMSFSFLAEYSFTKFKTAWFVDNM